MKTKIQWHPAFAAAMDLELIQNRNDLIYEKEYNLNTKPLEIDLLVIKKNGAVHIANEIGYLFKGHNIVEYKSPEDHLDIDTFYKSMAYASLYKSYGKTVDEIKADDITVSIIREIKPAGLFHYFEEHSFSVTNPYRGIYYIEGQLMFPAQVIVTGELDKKYHKWLGALSGQLQKDNIQELLDSRNQMTQKADLELADSILEVCIGANRHIIEELMEDDSMYEALMEIMEPKIKLREDKIWEEAQKKILAAQNEVMAAQNEVLAVRKEDIQGTINILRNLNIENPKIKSEIIKAYKLSESEAEEYL